MHVTRVGVTLIDDVRHLVTVNVGGVGEQMRSVFIRLCLKTAANVISAVGVKIITVSCVQTCVSKFVADRHLLSRIAEIIIQNDVFAPQHIYEKAPHIIGEWETHNRYAEIARKLEWVSRAVFVDEILDAERNVHRLHLFCGDVCGKRKNPVKLDWVLLCPSGHTTEPAKGACIIIIHEQRGSVKKCKNPVRQYCHTGLSYALVEHESEFAAHDHFVSVL